MKSEPSKSSAPESDPRGDELVEHLRMACMGELAGVVTHEFNNYLNALLLNLAVLEQGLPEGPRGDLARIRQQGKAMAAVIRLWQQDPRRQRSAPRPVDLNVLVRDVASSLDGVPVTLELAPALPPLSSCGPELRRLCALLLANAAAAGSGEGRLTVRTVVAQGKALLQVEDTSQAPAAELLGRLFELAGARPGTNALELSACQSLAQRLHGRLTGAARPGGGLVLTVELPFAS